MSTLERAISLACSGHAGQLDKAGQPYILHCLRVMQAQTTEIGMIVGVLHDFKEDVKDVSLHQKLSDFDDRVSDSLLFLTRGHDEPYANYIRKLAVCHRRAITIPVKIADLKDNMNTLRLATFTNYDAKRLVKYHHALRYLESINLAS